MKLSAPVYHLKRKAKTLSREENIPLLEALDRIAREEGYKDWSLLAARQAALTPAAKLFARLAPGDLLLIGARPGQGKTLLSLELAAEAMKRGHRAAFFTLECAEKDVLDRFRDLGVDISQFEGLFEFDGSDAVSADYIIGRMALASRGALAVVDYLQILDQKRENPELSAQVRALHAFARDRGLIIVCISQVHRSYDPSKKPFPDVLDVRLPNPVDLNLFNKTCFLNKGEVRFDAGR